jgi:hypothetical protein
MSSFEIILQTVEEFYRHLKNDNHFFRSVFNGRVGAEHLYFLTKSINHAIENNYRHFAIGLEESTKRNLPKLAEFYKHKHKEEFGHDQWAKSDMENLLSRIPPSSPYLTMDLGISRLVAYNDKIIRQDPHRYLVYMVFAEYLTVIGGSEIWGPLQKLKFGEKDFSVITKHVELDKHHVKEWGEVIEDLVDTKVYAPIFMEDLKNICQLYFEFTDEICRELYTDATHQAA